MSADRTSDPIEGSESENREQTIENTVGEYIDRLNAGEEIRPEDIFASHPDMAPEILEHLEYFMDLDGASRLGTFGDYTLRRCIGRGGMGVVYEAWQSSLDRLVALKILPSGVAADNRSFIRFMREARAAGHLNHPNIVHVYAMGVEDGTPYYTMEFVEGETLAQILERVCGAVQDSLEILQGISDLLKGGGRPEGEGEQPELEPKDRPTPAEADKTSPEYYVNLARAFAGAAEGLQHAHSRGVIHRDIKPSNLILDSEGRLRILDFGLARIEGQDSLTGSEDLLGTPLYMSPEQAGGYKALVDHRTDVYSLGATLYEMLTWRPPFTGKDYRDTLNRIISVDPVEPRKLNPHVPRDLEIIVLKCMRKEPADRYGTAEALGQDLRRFVRGDPIEARPQSAVEKTLRRLKRHLRTVGVAALILVLSVVTVLLVHQYSVNVDQERVRREEERFAAFEKRIARAASRIQLGEMHIRASSHKKNRLDPEGIFNAHRFEEVVQESPLIPAAEALSEIEGARPFPKGGNEAYYHWARALALGNDVVGALAKLKLLFECEPGFVPGRMLAAELYRRVGDLDNAEVQKNYALSHASRPWEEAWLEARRAEAEKRWEDAGAAYSRLLEETASGRVPYHGLRLETRLRRGLVLLKARKYEQAIADFVIANNTWPQAVEPYVLLGRAYYIVRKPELARAVFQRFYQSRPPQTKDNAAVWITVSYMYFRQWEKALKWAGKISNPVLSARLRGFLLYQLKRLEKAEAAARKAVALNPKNGMSYMVLADILRAQRKFKEALAACRAAMRYDEGFFGPYYTMAAIYYDLGDFLNSEKYCREALKRNPDHPRTLRALGVILVRKGEAEKGLSVLERSYKLGPSPLTCVFIALTLERLQRPGYRRRQLELYEEAGRSGDELEILWMNWAVALYEGFGKFEEALEKIQKAEALTDNEALVFGNLGFIYENLGRKEAAVEYYRKAIHCQRHAPWNNLLHIINLGIVLSRRSKLPDARKEGVALLKWATDLWPKNYGVHLQYGAALMDNERYREAHVALDRALELKPRDVLTLGYLAELYKRDQKPLEALTAFLEALKAGPGRHYTLIITGLTDLFSSFRTCHFGGRLDEARVLLENELKKGPPRPHLVWAAWLTQAFVQRGMGVSEVIEAAGRLSSRLNLGKAGAEQEHATLVLSALKQLKEKGVLRINCGGEAYTDPSGATWLSDRFFFGGRPKDAIGEMSRADVSGTEADELFYSARVYPYWGGEQGGYWIPVIPGRYRVTLYFGDPLGVTVEPRRFSIKIEGREVLPLYDTRSVGVATADQRTFELEETDAIINIAFSPKLMNAFVCAIEVRKI